MIDLNPYLSDLKKVCEKFAVKRLDLVGSVARDDFDYEASDLDFVIEFHGSENLFHRYFDLKFALEKVFDREVDLIQETAIKNPYFRKSIGEDRITIYEA